MAFTNKQYKGVVVSSLNKYAPTSLGAARIRLIQVWGEKLPELLLDEWAEEWWKKRRNSAAPSPKKRRVRVLRPKEITLTDLKAADELSALMSSLLLTTSDVSKIVNTVQSLGGLDHAITTVEELRQLRKQRPNRDGQRLLFDQDGSVEDEVISAISN